MKRILTCFIAVILTFSFAACQEQTEESPDTSAPVSVVTEP